MSLALPLMIACGVVLAAATPEAAAPAARPTTTVAPAAASEGAVTPATDRAATPSARATPAVSATSPAAATPPATPSPSAPSAAAAVGAAQAAPPALDPRGVAVLERFFSGWAKARSLTMRIVKLERQRSGELRSEEAAIKFMRPFSLYIAALKPAPGQEVIYAAARDAEHLIVHPGRFPDVTLTLDLRGSLATAKQHHTVMHSGFDYTARVLRRALTEAQKDPQGERIVYGGRTTLWGRGVEVVVFHAGARRPRRVVARAGETAITLAERSGGDAYRIYCANPEIAELSDELETGRAYVVPAYYGIRSELAVDDQLNVPIRHSVYDEVGLYEQYEFRDVIIDPPLGPQDFDPENPVYRF